MQSDEGSNRTAEAGTVSATDKVEMSGWLRKHGFVVEELWGDRHRSPYTDNSGRAIFWAARK